MAKKEEKRMTMTLEFYARAKKRIPSVTFTFTGAGLAKTGEDKAFDEFSAACHKYCASLMQDGEL